MEAATTPGSRAPTTSTDPARDAGQPRVVGRLLLFPESRPLKPRRGSGSILGRSAGCSGRLVSRPSPSTIKSATDGIIPDVLRPEPLRLQSFLMRLYRIALSSRRKAVLSSSSSCLAAL
jgi:hypothetical protein